MATMDEPGYEIEPWMKDHIDDVLEDLFSAEYDANLLREPYEIKFRELFYKAHNHKVGVIYEPHVNANASWFFGDEITEHGKMLRVFVHTSIGDVAFGIINIPGIGCVYFFGMDEGLADFVPEDELDTICCFLLTGEWEVLYGFTDPPVPCLLKQLTSHAKNAFH
jgi:hypothetical protein